MDMPIRTLKNGNDFIMTNAPMATLGKDNYSDDIEIVYLPEFDTSKMYATEALAREKAQSEGPSVEINVERIAVKMTLTGNSTMKGCRLTTNEDVGYDYNGIKYCTDVRNTQSYNVRHVSKDYLGYEVGSKGKRFLDGTATTTGLYRIFWAEDLNYDYQYTTGVPEFTVEPERGPNNTNYYFNDASIESNLYQHENTMNVNGLVQGHTTRLYIRIPFVTGKNGENKDVTEESFYTLSTESQDLIYLASGVATRDGSGKVTKENDLTIRQYANGEPETDDTKTKVKTKVNRTSTGTDTDKAKITIAEKIISIVGQMPKYKTWKASCSDETKGKADSEILVVTMFNGVQGQPGAPAVLPAYGKAKVLISVNTSINATDKESFNTTFNTTEVTETGTYTHSENDLDKKLNEEIKFNYYDKGYAYYKVLVRHFGDDEVADYEKDQGSNYGDVYPSDNRARNYLGRYGIVRNTWYTITLTGVKHIGYSDDVPLNISTPDDEVDNYLSVKVNVNKWAQRGQKNTL